MRHSRRWVICCGLLLLLLTACGRAETGGMPPSPAAPTEVGGEPREVRLVTHESFSVSEEVLAAFESEYNAKVVLVPLGDAGTMVNSSILSAKNPLGDVLYGLDNTLLARALDADIFQPYESPNLANVPDMFKLDPDHRVTPIDYGDVCLNYDKEYFDEAGIAPPATLEDLTKPEYRELTVVENPGSSSPGMAFLLATVAHFGEDGWQSYWSDLRDNGVLVTSSWSEAYFEKFTAGGGEGAAWPIVVSYASSPAAAEGRTANVLSEDSCFRQIEFAGVLSNGKEPDLARALVDFMLSPAFQSDVPAQMYVYPVVEGTPLPEAFEKYAEIPTDPAILEPSFIEQNRDMLTNTWTDVMLR